jgi:hypothetical protein
MTMSILAGSAYFVIVFAAAFALGALRITFIVPAVGSVWATLLELPFMLVLSWMACGWLVRFLGMPSLGQSIGMAASAFALLMGAEAVGSILIFGRSFSDHIGSYGTAAGALGLAGQIVFGLFPIVQYLSGTTGRTVSDVAPATLVDAS